MLSSDFLHRVASADEMSALATLLACLRALGVVHQAHHWQTQGPDFYGDHLLFERLYADIVEETDQLAERCVGLIGPGMVDPIEQSAVVAAFVKSWCSATANMGTGPFISVSLAAEKDFLGVSKATAESLKASGQLSRGTDNLLAGIEDKHEEHVYLLSQRMK